MFKIIIAFFLAQNLWAMPHNLNSKKSIRSEDAVEGWVSAGSKKFGIFQSLDRSQGITNDGKGHFWFSANQKLMRVKSDYTSVEASNSSPFSAALKDLDANHIGDIDYYNGKIYAPIEDGNTYKHPVIAAYNAQTLKLETFEEVPRNWQPDGVPWIAVDGPDNYLISAQYSNTTRINFYDLSTFQQVKQVELSHMITSIQGGKVFNGSLYMTANNDKPNSFALYKMNLVSGQVDKILVFNSAITEIEGLTFENRGNEVYLHVLSITGNGLGRRIVLFDFKKSAD